MKKQKLISIITLFIFSLMILSGCTSNKEQTTERTQSVNVEDKDSETSLSTDGDWDDDDDDDDNGLQSNADDQSTHSGNLLTEKEIQSIVEKHTKALKGSKLMTKVDTEDGIQVYEVDGKTSTHEYEFEINAVSGEIISYSEELIHTQTQNHASSSLISEKKVRSIVEKQTSALKGKNLIIERDTDDGLKVYEIEAKISTHKYEFEIDAYTGEIISYSEKLIH